MAKMNKERLIKKCMVLIPMVQLQMGLMGNQKDERETINYIQKKDKENRAEKTMSELYILYNELFNWQGIEKKFIKKPYSTSVRKNISKKLFDNKWGLYNVQPAFVHDVIHYKEKNLVSEIKDYINKNYNKN